MRGFGQRGRADQPVLHPRKFTFRAARIRPAKVVGHDEAEDRIAEKLERFVVQFARFELLTGRDFLMRPRPVCDGPFEQRTIFESVSENRFEEVQIGNRFGIFQNAEL